MACTNVDIIDIPSGAQQISDFLIIDLNIGDFHFVCDVLIFILREGL